MKFNRIALAVLLAGSMAASAQAALLNVTPLVGYHMTDSKYDIDDSAFVGIAAGFKPLSSLAFEAEFGKSSDVKLMSANALFFINGDSGKALTPYVLAGFSQIDISAGKNDSTDTGINLGGGALYSLGNNMSLRGELRAVHNSDQSVTDYLALVGLQYGIGGEPAEAPAELPPAEPTNYVPADTDGDGVVDDNDRCPNTPSGWEVAVDGCPLDSDRDRVPNSIDECPNTPVGMAVGANGCPIDADRDGVSDANDKCPGTALNVVVDEKGCAKLVDSVIKDKVESKINIVFDVNKSVIKPEFEGEVAKIADLAKQYPTSFITIEGHTDSSGVPAKNLALSKARAEAVRSMLISKFGVAENRLMAVGYGQTKPVAPNTSVEGKALNRRVIAVLTGERTTVEQKQMLKPAAKKKAPVKAKGKKRTSAKKAR